MGNFELSTYTFTNVVANHTISATFSALPPAVLVISRNASGGLEITWPDAYANPRLKSDTIGAAANWQAVGPTDGVLTHVGSSYKFTPTPRPAAAFFSLGK